MIRQNYKQDILTSAGMMGPDDPLLLSCRAKASVRPLSRNNRLSHTPGLHLPTAPAEATSAPLKPSSSSSYSSSPALPEQEDGPENQKEAENLPPRRPQKLAPLKLPLEVKEAQWQKMSSVQQEVKASGRKLEAAGGEACEPCPRKVKACGSDGARSPARPPLITIVNPSKLQQRANRALRLPTSQLQPEEGERLEEKEAGPKERSPGPAAKPAHLCSTRQSAHTEKTAGQSTSAQQTINQSGHPEVQDTGYRRRPRLRRAQRLEEDHSKSGSFTAGLSGEEGKPGPAWTGPSRRSTEKALREASRILERASRRNAPVVPQEPRVEEKFSRRKAVYDIQEVAL